jgi:hypothetical protein
MNVEVFVDDQRIAARWTVVISNGQQWIGRVRSA